MRRASSFTSLLSSSSNSPAPARIVATPGSRFSTILAGAGELEDELKRLVKELALRNVQFAGLLPADQLAYLYSAADVSIVPSRVEPFGLVAIEAMACGTPVIATNAGGL